MTGSEDELEVIFEAPTGDARVRWGMGWSSQKTGYRQKPDGDREEVEFYGGEWGWLSRDELFAARQAYPHTAP